ncbi:fimbria/pilus outer membrane usher protein [Vibrio jasicida]|uniref:fimbria/pilus outer membrane usher protein n=1 Tax=Vibrio jasicida TaxID=766224 RepID=UPI004068EECB
MAEEFDTAFLQGSKQNSNTLLSVSSITEGVYYTSVSLNNRPLGRLKLVITPKEEKYGKFCFSLDFWQSLDVELLEEVKAIVFDPTEQCIDLMKLEFTSVEFDITKPALAINIPQGYFLKARYVKDAEVGINGLKFGYNINSYINSERQSSAYASVNTQLNTLGWVTNVDVVGSRSKEGETESNISNLYAQYVVDELGADLLIGKGYARSNVIDGFPFGGIGITSNSLMLDATESFIPHISGIANSLSKVTVRQYGRLVYSETVVPGPYVIDNFSVYGSGDLEVVIEDENGNIVKKSYPLFSSSSLIRDTYLEYNLAIGRRHDKSGIERLFDSNRTFMFADVRYGLPSMTLSGGVVIDEKYQTAGLGLSFYLRSYGALLLETRTSFAQYDNGEVFKGSTFGSEYTYHLSGDTNIQIASRRHIDEDYVTYLSFDSDSKARRYQSQKHRLQLSMVTQLGALNIRFQGWQQTYWGNDKPTLGGGFIHKRHALGASELGVVIESY